MSDAVSEEVAAPTPTLPLSAGGGEASLPIVPVGIAAALATAAGAWLAGGLFNDPLARLVGWVGVLIGAGLVTLAFRRRRALLLQLLVLPAAALAGAILTLPAARTGASLPTLVGHALRGAGILQPPVPFDPGWRFLLVVLGAALAATAASLAITFRRPKLAVAAPLALAVPAALLQPDSAEIWSAAGAIVLLVLALAAARNAELALQGELTAEFELNRLARSGASAAGLVLVLLVLARTGLLFPTSQREQVIPPHRPQVVAPPPDQVLFTYVASRPVPLRMGVLDTYDGRGWLLPEFDASRLKDVHPGGQFPEAAGKGAVLLRVTIGSLEGRTVPAPAGLVRLDGQVPLQFDPVTQTVRLADRSAVTGLTYAVEAAGPPASKQLQAASGRPAPRALQPYEQAPPAPVEVTRILAQASEDPFTRLQVLRQALYAKVVAEGEGKPVDVPPARVGAMFEGAHATPYEITAAEALLARWAGLPSRIGYGYDGGEKLPDGSVAVHPSHAGTWLEVYFAGSGWVPLVGVPPHAATTVSAARKNLSEGVQPAQNLSLVVYVPVAGGSGVLLYEVLRYYLLRAVPLIVLLVLAAFAYPALVKAWRRARRRSWAGNRLRERVAVAYAEFRDRCIDLGVGDPAAAPLDFLAALHPDAEHAELAWLVTRALWGDLRRDLRAEDAAAAEALARSLRRRVTGAQGFGTRLAAYISRASLRRPYSREVPNTWPAAGKQGSRGRRRLAFGAATAGLLVLALSLPALAATPEPGGEQLTGLVPAGFGKLELRHETSADAVFRRVKGTVVGAGRVYSVRHGGVVEGSVQVEQLVPALSTSDAEVRQGILANLGGGSFRDLATPVYLFDGRCMCPGAYRLVRVADQALHRHQKVFVEDLPDLRVYAWFPPGRDVLVVVALRSEFTRTSSDDLVLALVDDQRGVPPGPVPIP